MNDVPFRVIGILGARGYSANGRDLDDLVVAPISTVKSRLLGGYFRENRSAVAYLLIKGSSSEGLADLQPSIQRVLRGRHDIRPGAADDFNIRDPASALAASKSTSETLSLLLACIAGISLLVGGISIMNIMLVSVAERTREIGVRMAVGATRRDLRMQFFAESAGVALLGGAIGVAFGSVAALVIGFAMGWAVLIDIWICLGVLSSRPSLGFSLGCIPPCVRAASTRSTRSVSHRTATELWSFAPAVADCKADLARACTEWRYLAASELIDALFPIPYFSDCVRLHVLRQTAQRNNAGDSNNA